MTVVACLVLYSSYQLIAAIITGYVAAICDGCGFEPVTLGEDPVRFVWSVGIYSAVAGLGLVPPARFVFSRVARQRMQKLWREGPSR